MASGHCSGAWVLEALDALGAWEWVAYSCQGIESISKLATLESSLTIAKCSFISAS